MHIDRFVPPPGHPLHPLVESIWTVRGGRSDGGYAGETILPKGIVDVVFDLEGVAYAVTRGAEAFRSRSRPGRGRGCSGTASASC